ncbi:hypothetical protein [uncultured Bosea sp.]|uniref:hypothetical protein n=1 Tax=uncultured Bosea sp. TaxID=211457 RepID=UPI00263A5AD3|nr:hypothetical protein [uncultured Bosea sp.]
MSDEKQWPIMTAEDVGAAFAGFALSFAAALRTTEGGSANDALRALVDELASLSQGMRDPEGNSTPARDALRMAAAMLAASEPPKPRKQGAKAKRD